MSQVQRGDTFIDGQIVNAARLNNLVDLAIALNGLILDQAVGGISANDQVLIWDDTANALRRATCATLLASAVGVTSVALTMPSPTFNVTGSPITTTGTLAVSWDAQSANTILAGPPSGTTGTPGFRALNVADITPATITIPANNILNWDLGNTFTKVLSANTTFGFANPNEGQTITVRLQNDASRTVTWPGTVRWPGGVAHTMTAGVGRIDIIRFHYIGGLYYGTFNKDFLL